MAWFKCKNSQNEKKKKPPFNLGLIVIHSHKQEFVRRSLGSLSSAL